MIAIVTDSTADIAPQDARRLSIDVVPLFVNFGERRYRDRVDLSRADFYRLLETDALLPTTSQPTAAMFEEAFRPHVQAGREIVCITISQALSGTINAAQAGASAFANAPISLVDSKAVAGGLALQVMHAAELARRGADRPTIVAALEADRQRQAGFATVPDLTHAVRTGRVSRPLAFIGSLVKLVPVLRFDDGRVEEQARVRTFARARETMVDAAVERAGVVENLRVMVMHTNAPEVAASVADRLREKLPGTPHSLGVQEAGPAIATHAGQGAVGVFVLPGAG